MSGFRPLLAAPIEEESQLNLLSYPLIGSPKLDGIRVLIHPEIGPCTRSLKKVHNSHVYHSLNSEDLRHLDGEVVVGAHSGQGVFARTTSGVMSFDGEPFFTYWVFDCFQFPGAPYHARFSQATTRVANFAYDHVPGAIPRVEILEHKILNGPAEVLEAEREYLERGFEGIMLRHPQGQYKFNRSTFKQQILLKMKRFKDDEATVIGFEALTRNENPQERNSLGLAERSDHKAGLREVQTLGNLLVRHPRFGDFSVGSGFDEATREHIWNNQAEYNGRSITFKYQEVGVVDKPRFPIFKGFRPQE